MSILTQLNVLNISIDDLKNLSAKDIIKIEKQLKAKVKLDESIDINEVEKIIAVLKNNPKEICLLFDSELKPLRYILQNSAPKTLSISHRVDKYDVNFKDFLNTNFKNEIDLYIINCFKEDQYRALHSLLKLQELFDFQVLEGITQRLHEKINFGIEQHKLHEYNYHSKATYFTNLYFFRCLNLLTTSIFEAELITLLDLIDQKYKDQKDSYLLKIFFSISEFNFIRDDIKKFVKYYKQLAIKKGIIETNHGNSKEKNQKGGTKDAYENTSSTLNVAIVSILALVFVVFLIITALKSSKKEEIPSIINTRYKYDKYYQLNIDSIEFFQSLNYNIISEKDIELNMDTIRKYKVTYFKDFDSSFFKAEFDKYYHKELITSTIFYNLSEYSLILMTEGGGYNKYETLHVNDTLVFNTPIRSFKLYIGGSPQIIKYLTYANDTLIGFRFKDWNYIDQEQFSTTYFIKSALQTNTVSIYNYKNNNLKLRSIYTKLNIK